MYYLKIINASISSDFEVGGGAAGCVVAGMLSEAGFSVLLVEKGGDPAPPIMSPFLPSVRFDNIANDFYTSLPQRNAALRTGGVRLGFKLMLQTSH